jgi:hypothetical protein
MQATISLTSFMTLHGSSRSLHSLLTGIVVSKIKVPTKMLATPRPRAAASGTIATEVASRKRLLNPNPKKVKLMAAAHACARDL